MEQQLTQFAAEWNVIHPELPAVVRGSDVLIAQDKFPYGNITVEYRHDKFEISANQFDGEEMETELEWVGEDVAGAIVGAEWQMHPGDTCAECGLKMEWWYESRKNFRKIGCKLYCVSHVAKL